MGSSLPTSVRIGIVSILYKWWIKTCLSLNSNQSWITEPNNYLPRSFILRKHTKMNTIVCLGLALACCISMTVATYTYIPHGYGGYMPGSTGVGGGLFGGSGSFGGSGMGGGIGGVFGIIIQLFVFILVINLLTSSLSGVSGGLSLGSN